MTAPIEAACDRCAQTRPLFLYQPLHSVHLGGSALTCRWCARDKQPLLCSRCWGTERETEENDPALDAEAGTWERICAANGRAIAREVARTTADRETCDGIAAATEQTAT